MSSSSLYAYNEKGFRSYEVERLRVEQCDIAAQSCTDKASGERFSVIAITASAVIGAAAIVLISLLVAKVATPLLLSSLAGYGLSSAILTAARISTHSLTYLMGLIALKRLWDGTNASIKWHQDYAAHLDQQAVDIKMQKAALES
ncbi:MAG: hypothetical protein P0S96_00125 [Simkaniaceae bacterium]|nr:hypothetical protein [Candidatus Sacchlamyda saccharinae]